MTRTLLEICQDIADEAAVNRPASIVGSRDKTARRLLISANTAGRVLADGKVYSSRGELVGTHDWRALQSEQTFDTVASQQSYQLKGFDSIFDNDDYKRLVADTIWDRVNDRPIRVVDSKEWQTYVSGIVTLGINKLMIIRGGALVFYTTPTSADTYVVEYISSKWAENSSGGLLEKFTNDTDKPRLDDHLIYLGAKWRFKESMGLPYAEDKLDYLEAVHVEASREMAASTLYLASVDELRPNIPDTGYG